jgi:hypothetical protein
LAISPIANNNNDGNSKFVVWQTAKPLQGSRFSQQHQQQPPADNKWQPVIEPQHPSQLTARSIHRDSNVNSAPQFQQFRPTSNIEFQEQFRPPAAAGTANLGDLYAHVQAAKFDEANYSNEQNRNDTNQPEFDYDTDYYEYVTDDSVNNNGGDENSENQQPIELTTIPSNVEVSIVDIPLTTHNPSVQISSPASNIDSTHTTEWSISVETDKRNASIALQELINTLGAEKFAKLLPPGIKLVATETTLAVVTESSTSTTTTYPLVSPRARKLNLEFNSKPATVADSKTVGDALDNLFGHSRVAVGSPHRKFGPKKTVGDLFDEIDFGLDAGLLPKDYVVSTTNKPAAGSGGAVTLPKQLEDLLKSLQVSNLEESLLASGMKVSDSSTAPSVGPSKY